MAVLRVKDDEGNLINIPAIKGDNGKSAYQSAVDGGYTGTEEEFNSLLANLGGLNTIEKPTATIELSAAEGFINNSDIIVPNENSFCIGDFWYMHDENTLPVGTKIKKIELKGQDSEEWVDINNMYEIDNSFMNIFYDKVYLSPAGIKVFGVAIYNNSSQNFVVKELNEGAYPVARITYYTD